MRIGPIEIEVPVLLAPMAAVTDLPFRTVCEELGAGFTITEFLSAHALTYGDPKAFKPGEKVTAADFTFEVLRSGPGRMVCYDLSGWPGEEKWSVECTSSDANMPRIAQNRAFSEMGSKATPTLAGGKPVLSSSGTGGIRELVLAAAKAKRSRRPTAPAGIRLCVAPATP